VDANRGFDSGGASDSQTTASFAPHYFLSLRGGVILSAAALRFCVSAEDVLYWLFADPRRQDLKIINDKIGRLNQ
jgi:hypothetical protein